MLEQSLSNAEIIDKALENGFDTVHFTTPDAIPEAPERLAEFLKNRYYGDMEWMLSNAEKRSNPQQLWSEVKTVIVLGMNYGSQRNPLKELEYTEKGVISQYAKGKDYHDVIKKKLKVVAGWIHTQTGQQVKVFVDTAPVMEKPLAQAAGLGWQGKHTNLVSREFGSWMFLSVIFTTAQITPSQPETDHCGSCSKCLDICPTDAFPAPYKLDARKCIAYLTIEYKGHIDPNFREAIGNRVFGCDDCLAVCPWNKYAKETNEIRFQARTEIDNPPLGELLTLDDSKFRKLFAGTPVKRTGRDRFIRNVLIAAGNAQEKSLLPLIQELLSDSSPLVRAMAIWACSRIMKKSEFSELRHKFSHDETDDYVLNEWAAEKR